MADAPIDDVAGLLGRVRDGDAAARDRLIALTYRDLEQIADGYARRPGVSIEPRGLIHELYLRLVRAPLDARDRKHFLAIAAQAMRQILIDRARRRRSAKRGGDAVRVTLTGLAGVVDLDEVLAVEQALERLTQHEPRQAHVVGLRLLAGLTIAEIADQLELSERTVHSAWRAGRTWLAHDLAASGQ